VLQGNSRITDNYR